MGGDLCADFSRGRVTGPDIGTATRTRTAARGDGAPSSGELGFGAGAPSEAKGFGGFEGGSGWRRSSCSSTTRRAARARGRRNQPRGLAVRPVRLPQLQEAGRLQPVSRVEIPPRHGHHPRERRRVRSKTRATGGEAEKTRGETRQKRWGERPGASTIPGRGQADVGAGMRTRGGTETGIGIGTGQKTHVRKRSSRRHPTPPPPTPRVIRTATTRTVARSAARTAARPGARRGNGDVSEENEGRTRRVGTSSKRGRERGRGRGRRGRARVPSDSRERPSKVSIFSA